jgi:hypothetical protein
MTPCLVRGGGAFPEIDDFTELAELVADRPDLFLRYSKGPDADAASGPSRDYESGETMPGLSVTTIGPEPWWSRPAADWVARRICKYAELGAEHDRFPWLLTGRVVGQGPDHEPLVTDAVPVARIGPRALDAARRRYRERFDVGQDSRS